ncbi:SitI3 family protein [Floridanema evergladense]|uniref:SitI3 family protein n=1 Tax=Floridaenema evergladense BLCC-F167 TaxID=3153639 RepID=A0ABV4WR61_9CYAN
MALNYILNLEANIKPVEALQIISKYLGLKWHKKDSLAGLGVIVYATLKSQIGQEVIAEEFGFQPSIVVDFRINPKDAYKEGKDTLIKGTLDLLDRFQGDAVLLFNGEQPVLQRINGKLRLYSGWEATLINIFHDRKLTYELYQPQSSATNIKLG